MAETEEKWKNEKVEKGLSLDRLLNTDGKWQMRQKKK